jgi:hypothetical protein
LEAEYAEQVREQLSDLLGIELPVGTQVDWVQQAATLLAQVEANITAALSHAPMPHLSQGRWQLAKFPTLTAPLG